MVVGFIFVLLIYMLSFPEGSMESYLVGSCLVYWASQVGGGAAILNPDLHPNQCEKRTQRNPQHLDQKGCGILEKAFPRNPWLLKKWKVNFKKKVELWGIFWGTHMVSKAKQCLNYGRPGWFKPSWWLMWHAKYYLPCFVMCPPFHWKRDLEHNRNHGCEWSATEMF